MANISEIEHRQRRPVTIAAKPFWKDHCFQGRAVLPAVEAMQLLAGWIARFRPQAAKRPIGAARFDKFMEIPEDASRLAAFCDLTDLTDGTLRAELVTRSRAGATAMTRTKSHACIDFVPDPGYRFVMPVHPTDQTTKDCFAVGPSRIYEALVPFGAAYRNICEPLYLHENGARTVVRAPDMDGAHYESRLGSPFVLDAAFHAACVWGQRFTGVVAFPVGIDARGILEPTVAGESYACQVFPVQRNKEMLVFDLWISDSRDTLREAALGVRMRDVSGGRWQPPDWILA